MSDQIQMRGESQGPRRRRRDEQPTIRPVGPTGPVYREEAEAMRQRLERLDAALASGVTNLPVAGPSVVVGQQQTHQVARPAAQIVRSVSNETLVQSFRQTPGE